MLICLCNLLALNVAQLKIVQLEEESREYKEASRYFHSTMFSTTLTAKTYHLNEVFEIYVPEREAEVSQPLTSRPV